MHTALIMRVLVALVSAALLAPLVAACDDGSSELTGRRGASRGGNAGGSIEGEADEPSEPAYSQSSSTPDPSGDPSADASAPVVSGEEAFRHPLAYGYLPGYTQIGGQTPGYSGVHTASDAKSNAFGDAFFSPHDGEIIERSDSGVGTCGQTLTVRFENGLCAMFCHIRNLKVARGEKVSIGQQLGEVGSCGAGCPAHLHWAVMDKALCSAARHPVDGYAASVRADTYPFFRATSGIPSGQNLGAGRFVDPNAIIGKKPAETAY